MFETAIAELSKALDGLRPKRAKCAELLNGVDDKETRDKLLKKYLELRDRVDRAALCIDILSFNVSLEVSDDWQAVKFSREGG